jgi:hypothetical protein
MSGLLLPQLYCFWHDEPMPDAKLISWISEKYNAIAADLDERTRRRWAAAEARSLGWGGIVAVDAATGISERTIRPGIYELDDPLAASAGRQRRVGAGRKSREAEQPNLMVHLRKLVDSGTRGDPMSPIRWTCKSTKVLAAELQRQGFRILIRQGMFGRLLLSGVGYVRLAKIGTNSFDLLLCSAKKRPCL